MRDARAILAVLCALLAAVVQGGEPQTASPANVLRHAIVVTINGVQITQTDLKEMANFLFTLRYGKQPPAFTAAEYEQLNSLYRESAIRELIKIWLIADEAKDLSVTVPVEDVDKQITRMRLSADTAEPMHRRFAETELLFDRILLQQGIPTYQPSPSEVRAFYTKNRAAFREKCLVIVRSIFMGCDDPKRADKIREKVNLLRTAILKKPLAERGPLVASLAKEFSEDAFANDGGVLRITNDKEGWFPQEIPNPTIDGKALFPEAMHHAIRGLSTKSEVSPVIQSERGFHLLYLEDIKGGRDLPFQDCVPLIMRFLDQRERKKRMRKWIREKWERSDVKWHDGEPYPIENVLETLADDSESRRLSGQ